VSSAPGSSADLEPYHVIGSWTEPYHVIGFSVKRDSKRAIMSENARRDAPVRKSFKRGTPQRAGGSSKGAGDTRPDSRRGVESVRRGVLLGRHDSPNRECGRVSLPTLQYYSATRKALSRLRRGHRRAFRRHNRGCRRKSGGISAGRLLAGDSRTRLKALISALGGFLIGSGNRDVGPNSWRGSCATLARRLRFCTPDFAAGRPGHGALDRPHIKRPR